MRATLQLPIHHSPFTVEAIEMKYGKVKIFALLGCYRALIVVTDFWHNLSVPSSRDFLAPEEETDWLSRNVGNELLMNAASTSQRKRRSHFHRDGSFISHRKTNYTHGEVWRNIAIIFLQHLTSCWGLERAWRNLFCKMLDIWNSGLNGYTCWQKTPPPLARPFRALLPLFMWSLA